ncbi:hypothetical protein Q3G72_007838 [Acer saccharum]|nr:hypothetical protein Q3G72_007838 [Acer saccharum]
MGVVGVVASAFLLCFLVVFSYSFPFVLVMDISSSPLFCILLYDGSITVFDSRLRYWYLFRELAVRHNYSVEFSWVGGFVDIEPGFASQIAVFRSRLPPEEDNYPKDEDLAHNYKVIWEWDSNNQSRSSL